jgi:hypothetical protein
MRERWRESEAKGQDQQDFGWLLLCRAASSGVRGEKIGQDEDIECRNREMEDLRTSYGDVVEWWLRKVVENCEGAMQQRGFGLGW